MMVEAKRWLLWVEDNAPMTRGYQKKDHSKWQLLINDGGSQNMTIVGGRQCTND